MSNKIKLADGSVYYPLKYSYVSYWGTWRRFLGIVGEAIVELEVTPVNPTWENSWKDMGERIFVYPFINADRNETTNELPANVLKMIANKLPNHDRLLNYDYFSQIDFDLYEKVCNGGAQFEMCKKRPSINMDDEINEAWDNLARNRELEDL